MYATLFALFIASTMVVFVLSNQRHPKYSVTDTFATVSWLLLILLAVTSQGR
jgi:hypothetical protein